ncbi:MAG: hypothetical protein FWE80_08800 [Oscillospiraceae bacterium]|nr:hypothetical protein [Oscillospiraceae bacterium]
MTCEKCGGKLNTQDICSQCGHYRYAKKPPPDQSALRPHIEWRSGTLTAFLIFSFVYNIGWLLYGAGSIQENMWAEDRLFFVKIIVFSVLEILLCVCMFLLWRWSLGLYMGLPVLSGLLIPQLLVNYSVATPLRYLAVHIALRVLLFFIIYKKDREWID